MKSEWGFQSGDTDRPGALVSRATGYGFRFSVDSDTFSIVEIGRAVHRQR